MKKILAMLALAAMSFTTLNAQSTQNSSREKKEVTHQTTPEKAVKQTSATQPKVSTAGKGEEMKVGTPMKKDGTPDKRYSANKHLKKDGTPDKRYSKHKSTGENQIKPTKPNSQPNKPEKAAK